MTTYGMCTPAPLEGLVSPFTSTKPAKKEHDRVPGRGNGADQKEVEVARPIRDPDILWNPA